MTRAAPDAWYAQQLRITSFSAGPLELRHDYGWWQLVTNEEPESQSLRARERVLEEVGPFMSGQLMLHLEPERTDWLLHPTLNESDQKVPPNLGPYVTSARKFLTALEPWLKRAPEATRLAFGGVAMLPVEGKVEGYRLIAEYLPSIELDAEGSADFLYQINRPRKCRIGAQEILVNRVVRFSVQAARYFRVVATADGAAKPNAGPEVSALRIEFDVNTNPEFKGKLSSQDFPALLGQMLEYMDEILRNGDVR